MKVYPNHVTSLKADSDVEVEFPWSLKKSRKKSNGDELDHFTFQGR